jgi:hypothetical protein
VPPRARPSLGTGWGRALACAEADHVGGHDGGDREPAGQSQRLAEDNQAGQRREHRVDAHEDTKEASRDPAQRQQISDHRDSRAQQPGRGRTAQRDQRHRMAGKCPDADRNV